MIDKLVLDERASASTDKKGYFRKLVEYLNLRSPISSFASKIKAAKLLKKLYPFEVQG